MHDPLDNLRKTLIERFSIGELRTLCFKLRIDYENLPNTKGDLARELVVYCERRGSVDHLIEVGRQERADIDWDALSQVVDGEMVQGSVSEGQSSRSTRAQGGRTVHVHEGGVYIEGGVGSAGAVGGDQFVMSGDFRGANVNVRSTLRDVTQTIGGMANADEDTKAELAQLIAQLNDALQQAPEEKAEEAETVADYARDLVDEAATAQPNKPKIRITAEGLKMAAQNLAAVTPAVVGIATQIVGAVVRMAG